MSVSVGLDRILDIPCRQKSVSNRNLETRYLFPACSPMLFTTKCLPNFSSGLFGRILLDIKQVVTIFARLFGSVHGLIGMPHQQICIHIVLWIKRQANAG